MADSAQGKVCAAVCHGPAALTEAKVDGEYLVKGKRVMPVDPPPPCMRPSRGTARPGHSVVPEVAAGLTA